MKIDRADLYEKVWSTPLSQLAKVYGISDVAIAKVCDRHEIPRPMVGHWQRVRHGTAPTPPPLPEPVMPQGHAIEITEMPARRWKPSSVPDVNISRRLANPHPIVKEIQLGLQAARPDPHNGTLRPSHKSLAVRVSAELIGRTLRLLDGLLKAVESQGGKCEIRRDMPDQFLGASYSGESVSFRIRERLQASGASDRYGERMVLKPRGELEVEIVSFAARGLQKRWKDSAKRNVESQAGIIVATLEEVARLNGKRRIAIEAERRRYDAQRRELEARKRAEEQEQERVDLLRGMISDWRDSQEIQDFVREIEKQEIAGCVDLTEWALSVAARLDPMRHPDRLVELLVSGNKS